MTSDLGARRLRYLAVAVLLIAGLGGLLATSEARRNAAANAALDDVQNRVARVVDVWLEGHLTRQRRIAFDVLRSEGMGLAAHVESTDAAFAILLDADGRVMSLYPERPDLQPGEMLAGSFGHIDAVRAGAEYGLWATDQAVTGSGRVLATAVGASGQGNVLTLAFDPDATTLPSLLQASLNGLDGAEITVIEPDSGVLVIGERRSSDRGDVVRHTTTRTGLELALAAPASSVASLVGGTAEVGGRAVFLICSLLLLLGAFLLPSRTQGELPADRGSSRHQPDRPGLEPLTTVELPALHDWVQRIVAGDLAACNGTVDLDTELTTVLAPAEVLRTVVSTLVVNALQHRREEIPPRIVIHVAEAPGVLQLTVADNGEGVPDDRLRHMFSADGRAGQANGDDVPALAEVRRLVTRCGGQCWATAADPRGLVVHVQLPALAPQERAGHPAPSA